MMELPIPVLVEADFFISILRGDGMAENVLRLLERVLKGRWRYRHPSRSTTTSSRLTDQGDTPSRGS